jgi:hypothetical protein
MKSRGQVILELPTDQGLMIKRLSGQLAYSRATATVGGD